MDTKTREGKFEEMWNLLNYKFGGVCLDQTYSEIPENKGIVIVQDLMRKVSQALKLNRRVKINRMIRNIHKLLNNPDNVGRGWKVTDIIKLLEELRDEEEDV